MDHLLHKIAITLIPGIGSITGKKLIAYCGGPEAVFNEKKSTLVKIPGIGPQIAQSIIKQNVLQRAESEIRFISENNISTWYFLDKNYPDQLKHCEDGPIMLYGKGNINLNKKKIISIVGTRNATDYGKDFCTNLISDLTGFNPIIVSGLAYGIDIHAHRQAYKQHLQTIGILAHGLDTIYPGAHSKDVEKMIENGGILSEFVSGTKPDKENFPKRNRIVAGLADATIVIESAVTGGSLITANVANSYNKDVFAVPGKVNTPFSVGCNQLIKQHKAHLLESSKDLEYIMNWKTKTTRSVVPSLSKESLTPQELYLIEKLSVQGKLGIDQLKQETRIEANTMAEVLLNLEFLGIIKCSPGKIYELTL